MIIIPKNMSHYIHDDGHLTQFTSCLQVWWSGGMNSWVVMLGWGYLTPRKKMDGFAPTVSERAGHYINLRVIQKSTLTCSVRIMMNWKETPPSNCKEWSVVHFLTIENNSRAKIHSHLCIAFGEENVMNRKNIQNWQLIFDVPRREWRE